MVVPEIDAFKLVELAYKIGMCCMVPYSYLEMHRRFKEMKKGCKVSWFPTMFFYVLSTILTAIETVFWPAVLVGEGTRIKKQQNEFDPLKDITVFDGFILKDELTMTAGAIFSLYWYQGFRKAIQLKWEEESK